jgi:hypothetical protein
MTTTIGHVNTGTLTRSPLKIKVIKVDSPTLIWVHLRNSAEDFEELLDDLQRRMSRRSRLLHHRPDDIRPDEIVAVHDRRRWQRGVILNTYEDGTATIFLKDWARIIERPHCEIYQLEDRFREFEWRAIPCALAHTGPSPVKRIWPRRARELLRFLIEQREAWISIVGDVDEQAALVKMDIRNECGSGILDVKDILVKLGHAQDTERILEHAFPSV